MRTQYLKTGIFLHSLMIFISMSSVQAQVTTQPTTSALVTRHPDYAETRHTLSVAGKTLTYTARAGYIGIFDDHQKLIARMFFIAYDKEGIADRSKRPVTFAFNGGPGASSIFLHLGAMGPRQLIFPNEGKTMPANPSLVDNPATWLDFTDLVFIDPIGSGYSRAEKGVDAKQFYSVEGDIRSVGNFIRTYTTQYERWLSPKFLVGESYGATRACGLAKSLQEQFGLYVDGLVLVSAVLDFQTILFGQQNNLPYALAFPTYTATALYHKKLSPDLQRDPAKTIADATRWAMTDYWVALGKGDTLSPTERQAIIDRYAQFTGLPETLIDENNFRIHNQRFTKELLRREGRLIGLMDSRVVAYDLARAGEYSRYDPSFFMTIGPLSATMNNYVRKELQYENTLPYEYLNRKANDSWNYEYHGGSYVNVAPDLKDAMIKNYHLRVLIVRGYYDLTTPFYTNEYVINQMFLPPAIKKNVRYADYPSGHQIYTPIDVQRQLTEDARRFILNPKP